MILSLNIFQLYEIGDLQNNIRGVKPSSFTDAPLAVKRTCSPKSTRSSKNFLLNVSNVLSSDLKYPKPKSFYLYITPGKKNCSFPLSCCRISACPSESGRRERNWSACGQAESNRQERTIEECEKLLVIVVQPLKNFCQETALGTC